MNSRILIAALTGVVLTAGGCATSDGSPSEDGASADEYVYAGGSAVAVDSADNAVTWSDTVAVFTVVSGRPLAHERPEEESAIIGRRVTIQIDSIAWKRADGEQPPESFETQAPGWYRDDDGKLIPMRGETGIRIEVGKTYIAPIVYLFGQWGFDDSVLEVVDGVISAAQDQNFALAVELDGKSVAEAAKVLSSARPVPKSGPLRETTEEQLRAIGIDVG